MERATEVLPALENVFISGLKPFGPLKEAISEFASVRQLSDQPVSIHLERGSCRRAGKWIGRSVIDRRFLLSFP